MIGLYVHMSKSVPLLMIVLPNGNPWDINLSSMSGNLLKITFPPEPIITVTWRRPFIWILVVSAYLTLPTSHHMAPFLLFNISCIALYTTVGFYASLKKYTKLTTLWI